MVSTGTAILPALWEGCEMGMTGRAYIVSRTLENKIAIAENNDQNTLLVTLDVLKEILALLKEQEAEYSRLANEYLDLVKKASKKPDVVRCKDCEHFEHWYKDKGRCFLWQETGIDVFEDGYCNYGKRKDGEAEQTEQK